MHSLYLRYIEALVLAKVIKFSIEQALENDIRIDIASNAITRTSSVSEAKRGRVYVSEVC